MSCPAGYLAALRARRGEIECLKAGERNEERRSDYHERIADIMNSEAIAAEWDAKAAKGGE